MSKGGHVVMRGYVKKWFLEEIERMLKEFLDSNKEKKPNGTVQKVWSES